MLALGVAAVVAVPAGPVAAGAAALELVGADSQTLDLSLEELAALPQMTVKTENEFSDGMVTYKGPLVRDVLAKLGLDKLDQVRLIAANDYYVDIPTDDFVKYDAILAMEANGERLSRREKGPLWLMYPISDHAELKDPIYMRRLIWQVVRIQPL
ncbi:MAG: molybdopterin-dependent oxidoreductase [Amaricoccus sp.]